VGPRTGLDVCGGERNFLPLPGIQSAAGCGIAIFNSEWATLSHNETRVCVALVFPGQESLCATHVLLRQAFRCDISVVGVKNLQHLTLKTEVPRSFETSVTVYRSTRNDIPLESNIHV
jgi:hypothetical protein